MAVPLICEPGGHAGPVYPWFHCPAHGVTPAYLVCPHVLVGERVDEVKAPVFEGKKTPGQILCWRDHADTVKDGARPALGCEGCLRAV